MKSLALTLLLALPAAAGVAPAALETPAADVKLTEIDARASYTFGGSIDRGDYGSLDAIQTSLEATHRFPLGGEWFLRAGFAWERFDFGLGRAPLPSHLQGVSALLALELLRNGQVGFILQSRPGFYYANDFRADAFDAPTFLGLAWPVSDQLFFLGGVSFALLRDYPVIPAIGARWKINDRFALNLMFPEPRLTYEASDALKLWAGVEIAGGSFRADRREIDPSSLDGAAITYREIRLGAGFAWQTCPGARLEIAGGWVAHRKFDYFRADEKYETDGSAFVSCRLTSEF